MITLRPRRSLGATVGLQVVMLTVPLLMVLGALFSEMPARVAIAVGTVLLLAAAVWATVRFRATEVSASAHGIVERGFFGTTRIVPARTVERIIRLETYRGASLDTDEQFFAVDDDGKCLLRLRGSFWDSACMDRIAAVIDVPEEVRSEPVTFDELRRTDPGLPYWWEGLLSRADRVRGSRGR